MPDLRIHVNPDDSCSADADITIEQTSIVTGSSVTLIFTITDECGNEESCDFTFACTPPDVGCAHTPGYWKNHPEDVERCVNGETTIDCGINIQEALNYGSSNPWEILARAYTAAYLNNSGCTGGSWNCIIDDINEAKSKLCGTTTEEAATLTGYQRSRWTKLADRIDEFNNGEGGPGCPVECDEPVFGQEARLLQTTDHVTISKVTVFPNPFSGTTNLRK